jgi:class 3 adenylate cyclase
VAVPKVFFARSDAVALRLEQNLQTGPDARGEDRCSGGIRTDGGDPPSNSSSPHQIFFDQMDARLRFNCAIGRSGSMTTQNVAVLFTDIVGSTALSSQVTPDQADAIRRRHFSVLRQAIAESGGTEVKNLGDGLMVVFSSASAGLLCAVTMQQGVDRGNRDSQDSVGLRVGVSGGEVTCEDEDYFGDPVVEAARLCVLCDSGKVLAADVVRAMAGRRNRHECRPMGPLSLKGLPDPVETVEVIWEPLDDSTFNAIPLPDRLVPGPAAGIVGRGAEIETIACSFESVASGNACEAVLVAGEAGQGKTTLVASMARTAFNDGALVLFGHCEEDLSTPYQLFTEALGHYVSHAPEDQLRAHVVSYGSDLAGLVPALASRLPDLPPPRSTDPDTERYLMFAAVLGLLGLLSEGQPVVLVVDDLQWADRGSLLLLRHLITSGSTVRILVLGTYRDSELSRSSYLVEFLGSLRRLDGVSRIDLGGLDQGGVTTLMEATAGQALDGPGNALARAIFRETDGNPFFVSEVLRHLVATGAISRDDSGGWVAPARLFENTLPDGVREVIGARVVHLGAAAEGILSLAAVIGRDFDLELLVGTAKSTVDTVLDVLDAAAMGALVRELRDAPGRYTFVHALIQRTIYEQLGPTRRAQAHRRTAEALEELCRDEPGLRVGELARHWFHGRHAGDGEKALTYARQAGDAALESLAPDDALRYYSQAVDLLPELDRSDPRLEIDLNTGFGIAQRQIGDARFRETLLEAARQAADLEDTDRLVTAALANTRGFFSAMGAIDGERVSVLELALERLSDERPQRALVLSQLCQELTYGSPLEHRLALAEQALTIAEASDDDSLLVRVINDIVLPLRVPSLLDRTANWTAEAVTRAERLGDPVLLFWAHTFRTGVAACLGDIRELDRSIEMVQRLADHINQSTFHWISSCVRATRALIAGDTQRADHLIHEGLRIATEADEPDAAVFFGAQLSSLRWQEGSMVSVIPLMEQTAAANPGIPTFNSTLACALVNAGRDDEAQALLKELVISEFSLPMDTTWLTGMMQSSEAAIVCRDKVSATQLLARLRPWAGRWSYDDITTEGPVSHCLGGLSTVIGDYDSANQDFEQSAAMCARMEARFFAARTNLVWGQMLSERGAPGDHQKARELLVEAQTSARTHGYSVVEKRATDVLQLLG